MLDPLGPKNVEKSLRVLKPGGVVIGIGGPPDPAFAAEADGNAVLRLATRLLSLRVRRQARRLGVRYSFLFMRAAGDQLRGLTALARLGRHPPVVDRVFPFGSTSEALAHVDRGRAVGKVVVAMTEAENAHTVATPPKGTVMNQHSDPRPEAVTSYRDAPTRTVTAGGVSFAYRELGPRPASR